jgi:hypothetical protein
MVGTRGLRVRSECGAFSKPGRAGRPSLPSDERADDYGRSRTPVTELTRIPVWWLVLVCPDVWAN